MSEDYRKECLDWCIERLYDVVTLFFIAFTLVLGLVDVCLLPIYVIVGLFINKNITFTIAMSYCDWVDVTENKFIVKLRNRI